MHLYSALHPSGVAKWITSFGCGKGRNVTSDGWQVTLCDPMWYVSSRSGVNVKKQCYIADCYTCIINFHYTLLPEDGRDSLPLRWHQYPTKQLTYRYLKTYNLWHISQIHTVPIFYRLQSTFCSNQGTKWIKQKSNSSNLQNTSSWWTLNILR